MIVVIPSVKFDIRWKGCGEPMLDQFKKSFARCHVGSGPFRGIGARHLQRKMVECSVCLEKVKVEHRHTTACGHTFHKRCIDSWDDICVSKPFHCPMCRTELTSDRKSAEKRRRDYAEETSRVVVFDETSFMAILDPEERMQLSRALAVILSTESQVVIFRESDNQGASAASTHPAM